jgi:hypothetical protein
MAMAEFDIDDLIAAAREVAGDFACSKECSAGSVGAALSALLPHALPS